MCCEHLICAHCAQPVAEARCPVCRASRAQLHQSAGLPVSTLIAVIALLLSIGLLLGARLAG